MSLAFILYCLWVAACVAIEFAPATLRPQLRFGGLVAGFVPVIMAAFMVGLVPALFGLGGIIALFPAPFAALARIAVARADLTLDAARQWRAGGREGHA